MARSTSTAADPFAAAKPKPAKAAKQSDAPLIVASDIETYTGAKFTQAQVVQAIEGVIEGKDLEDRADSLLGTHRPTVLTAGRTEFAKVWLGHGSRPKTPNFMVDGTGTGLGIKLVFQNSSNVLDATKYAALANLIGAPAAEANTVKEDEFVLNSKMLNQTVKVKSRDGKVVEMQVMRAIAEALQDKFAPSPETTQELFHINPIFKTQKGLIDKGPSLVAPDRTPASVMRLAQFLELGLFTTQIKRMGGGKPGEDNDD